MTRSDELHILPNQLWNHRRDPFSRLIGQLKEGSRVIEIGTWFGMGSTQVFINLLPLKSELILIDQWAPYASEKDLKSNHLAEDMGLAMPQALMSTLSIVDEVKKLRPDLKISVIKGRSQDVLKFFQESSFDLIYIDGSHYYKDVDLDIGLSLPLIKPGGVLCGDDLEILPSEAPNGITEYAKEHLDEDFIAFNGVHFHPGVFLAVLDNIEGKIEGDSGIWWTKR